MKRRFVLPPAIMAGFCLLLAGRVTAQTFTTLHSFYDYYNEGANPHAGVILSRNVLYGTAKYDGRWRAGTVFAVNIDGTGFTNLHDFVGFPVGGGFPEAGLTLSNNVLYGASREGTSGDGTLFKISTDGTGFATLHTFSVNTDGSYPHAGLILSSNVLYGTAVNGGNQNRGTVFKVNIDGTGFTTLHSFTQISQTPTNSDGANPFGGLVLSGDTLYGTTQNGGSSGNGTIFAIKTDGSGFTTLHSFTALSGSYPFYTNWDGANPQAALVLSGDTLYGTAQNGGSSGSGSVFAINTDGTGFTMLHSFTEALGSGPYYTNSDGIFPEAGLILSGNILYGTAYNGGKSGNGTVFAVRTNGADFTMLHSFSGSDGANPLGGLIFASNTLYGTTVAGSGSVFSLSLGSINPPQPCDFVTGGGSITGTPSGGKANFGVAGGITNGAFWGHLNYTDHGNGMDVKDTAVTGYAVDPIDVGCRIIDYMVTIDGIVGTARVRSCDKGEPGRNDIFEIQLSNGYFASGHLGGNRSGGGNIQLHRCN